MSGAAVVDYTSTPARSSGIPRPSKLPTPRRPSNVTASVYAGNEAELELCNAGSRPSLALSSINTGSRTNLRQPIPLASLGHNKVNSVSRSSNIRKEYGFKKPDVRPQSRQQRPPSSNGTLATPSNGPRARKDTLGGLESARARQSSTSNSIRKPSISESYMDFDCPAETGFQTPKPAKRSRPSLSDRTIESLSQISPSPGCGRRTSNFFSPESPMPPPSRPASVMGGRIRPGTSDGNYVGNSFGAHVSPSKRPNPSSRMSVGPGSMATPSQRSVSAGLPRPTTLRKPNTPGMLSLPTAFADSVRSGSTAATTTNTKAHRASKTVAARLVKPSPSLEGAFDRQKPTNNTIRPLSASKQSAAVSADAAETIRKVSNSSAALREQIARAKAARRLPAGQRSKLLSEDQCAVSTDGPDHPTVTHSLLQKRIESARSDGRLNIAAMSLKRIPVEVTSMYDMEAMTSSSMAWNEVVDLTRLNAADNEFEELQEDQFPDNSIQDFDCDDDAKRGIFAGLEAMDLHGNILKNIPTGLRRLELLRSLNLSKNKLNNPCLDVIVQIPSLRDLRLAGNQLSGALPSSISNLQSLELFDVHENKLLDLPASLGELFHLRVLNVAGNQLTALPMESLAGLPLVELLAANNSLCGTLFPDAVRLWPRLQTLDVASNSLTSLVEEGALELPMLRSLDVSNNRLNALPDISEWFELLTLQADYNQIASLPPGLTALTKLRSVSLESNSITKLNEQIAFMDSLDILKVGNNPLRERKYLTMATQDIKADMQRRLQPSDFDGSSVLADESTNAWTTTGNNTLDLSHKSLEDINPDSLGTFLAGNVVRHLKLHHNLFTSTPVCLLLAQDLKTLNISNNLLEPALIAPLLLPQLNELILSTNKLTSFLPITTYLTAPDLRVLDVRGNRITGSLPVLRQRFKNLTTLSAADNAITEISAEGLKGLEMVDLSRNDIAHLPPEIGLLGGTLRCFSVGRNAFRVPRYTVLEKGTEATLAWLRDRLPVIHGGPEMVEPAAGAVGVRAVVEAPDWGPGL